MARFAGRSVVVAGAGSVGEGWGNGKAAAVSYAREGGRVLCVDRAAPAAAATCALITAEGHAATPFVADLTTPGAAEAMAEAALAAFGRIDVLHFNIGISTPGGVGALDWDEWDRVFDTNVKAAARAAQGMRRLRPIDVPLAVGGSVGAGHWRLRITGTHISSPGSPG